MFTNLADYDRHKDKMCDFPFAGSHKCVGFLNLVGYHGSTHSHLVPRDLRRGATGERHRGGVGLRASAILRIPHGDGMVPDARVVTVSMSFSVLFHSGFFFVRNSDGAGCYRPEARPS